MALKILGLVAVVFLSCACSKMKFKGQTDSERTIIPLTAIEEDESLLEQFPCDETSAARVQCHDEQPPVEICHVTADGSQATRCVNRDTVQTHLRESDSNDFLGDCESGSGIVPD